MSYGYIPAPPTLPIEQKSWFSRNWKWFLPTVIGVPIFLFALFIVGIFSLVSGMMKSSEPYQHAVSTASHDSRVVARLGEPVTSGWYASGNINLSNGVGNADLSIPLKGPQGHGTVYVVAKKAAGIWSYERLEVEIEGAPDRISLLPPPPQTEDK